MEAQISDYVNIILWIWGFHIIFSEGMILEGLGDRLEEKLGFLSMPVFACPICMSSIHGGIYYLIHFNIGIGIFAFMIHLVALNFFVSLIINKIDEN